MKTATPGARKPAGLDRNRIAVLVPCYNEEVAVAKVVKAFKAAVSGKKAKILSNTCF